MKTKEKKISYIALITTLIGFFIASFCFQTKSLFKKHQFSTKLFAETSLETEYEEEEDEQGFLLTKFSEIAFKQPVCFLFNAFASCHIFKQDIQVLETDLPPPLVC